MIQNIMSARNGSPVGGAKPGGMTGNANIRASFGAMLQKASGQVGNDGENNLNNNLNNINAGNNVINPGNMGNNAVNPGNMGDNANNINAGINFSKHALARAEERGIELTPDLMNQLAGSVEKAREKGAKNILAFDSTQAFIINIPYGRVITTISQAEMRDNIFTNIDGAVLL